MFLRPTPPLSEEASKEILAELEHPVKDTPALKKQKERQTVAAALSEKQNKSEETPGNSLIANSADIELNGEHFWKGNALFV